MLVIRELEKGDWPAIWRMLQPVIRAAETYPYAADMTEAGAHEMWIEIPEASYVAESETGDLLGTCYIKPNQPTIGAHVTNCGYIIGESARGQIVATALCEHSQKEALRPGYRAMQCNIVVRPMRQAFTSGKNSVSRLLVCCLKRSGTRNTTTSTPT